jgi:hypothetical protein
VDRQAAAGVAVVDPGTVQRVLRRRPTIGGDQAAMVRWLTRSGAGVEVVVGKAGAGRTFALDAARDAWQTTGHRVVGTALAARAAQELHTGAGIPSLTLARLLADLDRDDGRLGLTDGTVVVVDEAGMVGTRSLARLLAHADRGGAKVVLVGDPHQLPEIDAGGLFHALAHRLDAIVLADNRRQHAAWERAPPHPLDDLRDGDVTAAITAYAKHGRIVTASTRDELAERLVDDWWAARQTSPSQTGLMVAGRRDDVDDLNQRARERLADAGRLTGPEMSAPGRAFRAGDEVLFTRNDYRLGVVNGQRGIIRTVSDDGLNVTTAGCTITVGRDYLDNGHLQHGYATTAHNALYLTDDRQASVGPVALAREGRQRLANDTGIPASPAEHSTPQQRRLHQVCALRDDARRELDRADATAADARQRRDAAEGGIGKVTRRHAVAELRRQVAIAEMAHARWQERLSDLDQEIEHLTRQCADHAGQPQWSADPGPEGHL